MEIPKAIDTELSIIGAALLYPKLLPIMISLTVDDFYDSRNRAIWQAILDIIGKGQTPEPLLVKNACNAASGIELTDLLQATESACMSSNVDHCVRILRETERERRLFFAIHKAQAAIRDGVEVSIIESELIDTISKRTASENVTNISDEVDLEKLLSGGDKQPWCSFGIGKVDEATGGMRKGEVSIVAARSSVGKSALAIASAVECMKAGWNVLYCSYEMSKRQLWYRMISFQSDVSLRKFRDMSFTEFDKRAIREAMTELEPYWKRFRVCTGANTPSSLAQIIRMEQMSCGTDMVYVDHAGRMTTDKGNKSDYSRMSEIANALKDISLNLEVPILVLWQLNRQAANREPTIADLRDTGQAEEVADMVLLLNRDSYHDPKIDIYKAECVLNVAKARDGGQIGEIVFPWRHIISSKRVMFEGRKEQPYEPIHWTDK